MSVLLVIGFVFVCWFCWQGIKEYLKAPEDNFTKWLNGKSDTML